MWISSENNCYTTTTDFTRFCGPLNIEWDHWPVTQLPVEVLENAFRHPEAQQAVLTCIEAPLTVLKQRHGYLTEDIVALSKDTPNLENLLAMFDKEHHHTDDEVRAVLAGEGIFGIVPPEGPPFEIHLQTGDLIVVPASTRHWFTLTEQKMIVALRVFKTPAGWTAVYNT